jgi:phosphatidylinositol dimannoside acyltransferase
VNGPSEANAMNPWDVKGSAWRKFAYWGSRFGPRPLIKYGPDWFGIVFGLTLQNERQAVRNNLRRLFGPRPAWIEERDILRTFTAYAHCLAESLGAARKDARAAECVYTRQAELDALLKGRGGFIMGTAHTGGWDVTTQLLMERSERHVVVVMDSEPDARARALQDALRGKNGLEIAHLGADALAALPLLRHLKQGGVVAVQLDRPPAHSRSVRVELGREPYRMPLGPFVLASLAQVPLLPVFVARRGYYRYLAQVETAMTLPRRMSALDAEVAAQRVARQLEAFLVDNPEQWFNFDLQVPDQSGP